ncbi:carotenoid oxygenase family protein [Azospirillum halopraeferens]|uniref:carotenoid oxygenase family protein n=1 Tax=Azospirillum halopraeferens TaxID=34010 RepID=UPI000419E13E|nr:carotenoid oxygenase family protein [Azospirillum halopraeferens]
MQRRTLLQAAGAATLAAALPAALRTAAAAGGAPVSLADAFDSALAGNPWLLGWEGRGREREPVRLVTEGRPPDGLAGTLYRNGPAGQVVGGVRYRHWFDGDGMVHAWRLAPDGAVYRSRFVRTRKFVAETAAGRPLVPAFGTLPPGVPALVPGDAMNPANISVLPLAGSLLALWEAGSAYDLDPDSLDTRGERVWREDLRGTPFSAHPKVDPDGTVWNFGVHYPEGRLMVWRLSPDGGLSRFALTDVRHPGMLHDMAVTGRSLVFVLAPFTLDPERWGRESFLDAHRWHGNRATRVVAVDKDDPSRVRTWELPAGFGFHFGNALEEADGTIRFDFALAPDARLVTDTLRAVMGGERADAAGPRAVLVTLRPGGGTSVEALGPEPAEFPRVDPRVVGRRNRHLVHLMRPEGSASPWLSALVRRDLETGAVDRFDFAAAEIPEEHVVVPRPGSDGEADGWLVGTVLDVARRRSGVSVFDARRVADGPLYRAWLDAPVPLGFHGAFAPA